MDQMNLKSLNEKAGFFLLLTVFATYTHLSLACTAFCLIKKDQIYLAKNLDWPVGLGYLFLNEKGITKSVLYYESSYRNVFTWTSKHRSITFNQFGKEFPLGGMNEHGLVIEELNMTPVPFKVDNKITPINEFQLVQYVLDNCSSVEEVIREMQNFRLKPLVIYLHYIIADKTGNTLILEFDGTKFNFYHPEKTGIRVLSNNNYSESLKYIENFEGFGGKLPVINRKGSNERFVSVANMLVNYKNQHPADYCFAILDSVKQDDTKWSIVYDITNLRIEFRFHSCSETKVFDFRDVLNLNPFADMGGDIASCNFIDLKGIRHVSKEENTRLINAAFFELNQISSNEIAQITIDKIIHTSKQ
jgi:choloylglycine hydrolase